MWQLININERSQDTRVGWRIEIEATICSRCCCCPAKAALNHTHSHTHVYTYECEHNNRSICRRSTHALACVGQTLGQGIIPKIDLNTTISDLRWRSSMDYLRWPVSVLYGIIPCAWVLRFGGSFQSSQQSALTHLRCHSAWRQPWPGNVDRMRSDRWYCAPARRMAVLYKRRCWAWVVLYVCRFNVALI